jgi:hypothetical protein
MQEVKTKYLIKILPNGSQCLSASTGMIETLENDSNVFEFNYTDDNSKHCDDNNNHFVDDNYKSKNNMNCSNTLYLKHCPVSYENNLDKLCSLMHIAAH